MKLKTKLFLSIGTLFLLVSLFSYLLPNFFLRRDIETTAQKYEGKLSPLMENLKEKATQKISIILLGSSLICLVIALLILNRIANKVSKPIVQLSNIAHDIEKGKFPTTIPKVKSSVEIEGLFHGIEKMVQSLKEREEIRSLLNKVVSKEVASEILQGKIELAGEERVATMLFSDIRGFTKMTESIAPKKVLELMNLYLNDVCAIIDQNKGVVDKFVGDEVMALFGLPISYSDHAFKAISTALAMIASLTKVNERRVKNNLFPVEIGIGIHTGNVVAGNVGSENRMNYTVLGANVNLAARLCSAAKGMQILISEDTLNQPKIKESFSFNEVGPISLKGIQREIKIFEIQSLK